MPQLSSEHRSAERLDGHHSATGQPSNVPSVSTCNRRVCKIPTDMMYKASKNNQEAIRTFRFQDPMPSKGVGWSHVPSSRQNPSNRSVGQYPKASIDSFQGKWRDENEEWVRTVSISGFGGGIPLVRRSYLPASTLQDALVPTHTGGVKGAPAIQEPVLNLLDGTLQHESRALFTKGFAGAESLGDPVSWQVSIDEGDNRQEVLVQFRDEQGSMETVARGWPRKV